MDAFDLYLAFVVGTDARGTVILIGPARDRCSGDSNSSRTSYSSNIGHQHRPAIFAFTRFWVYS